MRVESGGRNRRRCAVVTKDGSVMLQNFKLGSGETLPELKVHYFTLGEPHRNTAG
jgi:homoserine O-acetyltransferase